MTSISKMQKRVLKQLVKREYWYRGGPWHLVTPVTTHKTMRALLKKGFVRVGNYVCDDGTKVKGVYLPTDEGVEALSSAPTNNMGGSDLGNRQVAVLKSLSGSQERCWYAGCGWYYANRSTTEAILVSLQGRGLVGSYQAKIRRGREQTVYILTPKGIEEANKL